MSSVANTKVVVAIILVGIADKACRRDRSTKATPKGCLQSIILKSQSFFFVSFQNQFFSLTKNSHEKALNLSLLFSFALLRVSSIDDDGVVCVSSDDDDDELQ